MKIFALADTHLDHTKDKAMDVFGAAWKDHDARIFSAWKERVSDEDLVLLPGDISWALKWSEALEDLRALDQLPGKKLLLRGNHDYWWTSLKKMREEGFRTIDFIQNNSVVIDDVAICGTRGWIHPGGDQFDSQDEKIYARELQRLTLSLESIPQEITKRIAMIHYPPFLKQEMDSPFCRLLEEYQVSLCLYGHLHGEGHRHIVEGCLRGVEYLCVAADYIGFLPKEVFL